MAVAARIERPGTSDRRASGRRKLHLGSKSSHAADEVLIHDISTTGMLLATSVSFEPFEEIELELPRAGLIKARIVRTTSGLYGCQFLEPISKAAVSAALLRSPASPEEQTQEAPVESTSRAAMPHEKDLSFGIKMRLILAISLALWMLIFVVAWLAWRSV